MTLKRDFPVVIKKDLGEGVCHKGLQALKNTDSQLISPRDRRLCHGSADIDSALAVQQPQASRWDYVLVYDQQLHFVEVHPAHTSEVSQVKKKKDWLMVWLANAELGKLKVKRRFHWVASGKIAITRSGKQYRAAAAMGLKPVRQLTL